MQLQAGRWSSHLQRPPGKKASQLRAPGTGGTRTRSFITRSPGKEAWQGKGGRQPQEANLKNTLRQRVLYPQPPSLFPLAIEDGQDVSIVSRVGWSSPNVPPLSWSCSSVGGMSRVLQPALPQEVGAGGSKSVPSQDAWQGG